MKMSRQVSMKIGHQFGKRKPRWDFFTDQYQTLVHSSSNLLVKLLLASVLMQLLFFVPVFYWIFQNYQIIQTLVPIHFDIAENLEFEKKWIVFLVLASSLVASCWNAFLWLYVYRNITQNQSVTNDLVLLRDEAADQRLAS